MSWLNPFMYFRGYEWSIGNKIKIFFNKLFKTKIMVLPLHKHTSNLWRQRPCWHKRGSSAATSPDQTDRQTDWPLHHTAKAQYSKLSPEFFELVAITSANIKVCHDKIQRVVSFYSLLELALTGLCWIISPRCMQDWQPCQINLKTPSSLLI